MSVSKLKSLSQLSDTMDDLQPHDGYLEAADALSNLRGALSIVKSVADSYARAYASVQSVQYDADGNIEDVTTEEALSIPRNVFKSAIVDLNEWHDKLVSKLGLLGKVPIANNAVTIKSVHHKVLGCEYTLNLSDYSLTARRTTASYPSDTGYHYALTYNGACQLYIPASVELSSATLKQVYGMNLRITPLYNPVTNVFVGNVVDGELYRFNSTTSTTQMIVIHTSSWSKVSTQKKMSVTWTDWIDCQVVSTKILDSQFAYLAEVRENEIPAFFQKLASIDKRTSAGTNLISKILDTSVSALTPRDDGVIENCYYRSTYVAVTNVNMGQPLLGVPTYNGEAEVDLTAFVPDIQPAIDVLNTLSS